MMGGEGDANLFPLTCWHMPERTQRERERTFCHSIHPPPCVHKTLYDHLFYFLSLRKCALSKCVPFRRQRLDAYRRHNKSEWKGLVN